MQIETNILIATALIGFSLPAGIISLEAPVTINDSLVWDCLDDSQNAEKLMEALAFPEKWNPEGFSTVLPVHISVPERPALTLILMLLDNSDETEGYLLSCSEEGDIIDSLPLYYWNSEGFEAWKSCINSDGSVIISIQSADGWGDNLSDTTFLEEDGTFTMTMTSSSVMMDTEEQQKNP